MIIFELPRVKHTKIRKNIQKTPILHILELRLHILKVGGVKGKKLQARI